MSTSTQFISGVSATNNAQVVAGTVHGSVYFGNNEGSPLNQLPYAIEAPFNAYNRQHEPTCLPETRVDLLQRIYGWADSHDGRFIYWLSGLAGTGKSTIARTVARKYFEIGQLGASFFFSRGGGDVGNASRFFTSIALQLARQSPPLQRLICEALTKNADVATQSLGDQWRQIVLGPLSKLSGNSTSTSYILVIDALDECDNGEDIRIILILLAEVRTLLNVRLRILLTSRPEIPIRHGFYQIPETEHQEFVLHHISPSIVDHDIMVYLRHNLGLLGQEKPSLGADWPGDQILNQLIQNASGLFIWASTACRFIQEVKKVLLIRKRLTVILQTGSSIVKGHPEKHLDDIYTTVLKQSVPASCSEEEKEEFLRMLRDLLGGVVVLLSPLSVHSLSKLFDSQSEEVGDCLEDLHAILDIPDDHAHLLRLHHPSFRDFLLDKDRCHDLNFWVNEKDANEALAIRCIQLMSTSLKEDICGVRIPGTLVGDVESYRIERSLPPEVQYACLHWIKHIQKSDVVLQDNDHVHHFLKSHLLHWLEALGWMQKISEGILEIITLGSITSVANCPHLCAFVHDMKRFALHNRAGIVQAPLQVYYGALCFTPVMSITRRRFVEKIPRWVKRGPELETNWSATLQILEGHSRCVYALAFSPDGKQLASCSQDTTVRIWDTTTGATVQTLWGHTLPVYAVAFLSDGQQLASGSMDSTVRVWEVVTGALLQTFDYLSRGSSSMVFSPDGNWLAWGDHKIIKIRNLATDSTQPNLEGHSSFTSNLAFSSDGKQLASSSEDKTIRIWNVVTRQSLQTLVGHVDEVRAVAFSPDGNQLASGSRDQTVRIWSVSTGDTLHTLGGHSRVITAITFSRDGKKLASGSYDNTIRVWDATTGAAMQILEGYLAPYNSLAFSPDGTQLASGSSANAVRIWDAAMELILQTPEGHSSSVDMVAFSPDGKVLASASRDATVRIWNVSTGDTLHTLGGHSKMITAITFSRDGKQLASGSLDNKIRIWSVATGMALQSLEGHYNFVNALAFSPDGKRLVSGSHDDTIRIWDTARCARKTTLRILEGHSGPVLAVAFSPNGKQVASGSRNSTIRTWNTAKGATLQTLKGHSHSVVAVAFTPDGTQLASSSFDKTVKIWDLAAAAVMQTVEFGCVIKSLSFSSHVSIVTDRGRLDTTSLYGNETLSSVLSPHSSESSLARRPGIFVENEWVLYNEKRMLWLPGTYRFLFSAVHENVVCLGHESGRVSIIEFDFPRS